MSRGSLISVRAVDVVYIDVVGKASPTLAFLRDRFGDGSVIVLIVIAGNLTGVRYGDEILRLQFHLCKTIT